MLGLSLLMMASPEMETQLIFGLQGVCLLQGNGLIWKRRQKHKVRSSLLCPRFLFWLCWLPRRCRGVERLMFLRSVPGMRLTRDSCSANPQPRVHWQL